MELIITLDRDKSRFTTIVDGVEAFVEYIESEGVLDLTHTLVPKEIGGRGVAAKLVKYVLEYAQENNYKIIPTCSYVKVYMERHKELYGHLEQKVESRFKPIEGLNGHSCGSSKPK